MRNMKIKILEEQITELKSEDKNVFVTKQLTTVSQSVQKVKEKNTKLWQENSSLKDQILQSEAKMNRVKLENVRVKVKI